MTKQAYYYMQGFNIQNLTAITDYLDRWGMGGKSYNYLYR